MLYLILTLLIGCECYLNNWFPVVPISSTNFNNPKQIRILGKDLVLWKKGDEYMLQDDICPHRCAPLSEGYIDKESKNLRCAYHGWEFNEKGICENIPQAGKKYKYSNKSCLKNYETCSYGDLIWVYLGNEKITNYPKDIYELNGEVFMRELPIGINILLENFFDPAHVPIAHHKLQGLRERAKPIIINLLDNTSETFSVIFNETDGKVIERLGKMTYKKPVLYTIESLKVNTNLNLISGINIFAVPIQKDSTRLFVQYNFNKTNNNYKLYEMIPTWIKHVFLNKFLDSDTYILHRQEKYILKNSSYHENNKYFMPTSSDRSITLYKKWMKRNIPEIPYFNDYENGILTREEAFNIYKQHTKDCIHCNTAYKNIKNMQIINQILFLILSIKTDNINLIFLSIISYIVLEKIKNKFLFEDYIHNEID